MAETINNKPKLQLRSGSSFNASDKTPSPVPGLKINHGKPNYTLPRVGIKTSDGDAVAAHGKNTNNNYNPYRTASSTVVSSTKFNGVFIKPTTLPLSSSNNSSEDELGHVTLRRTRIADPPIKEAAAEDEDNVPEFIRRQRRIQERLAKENVLDFESRRSGYFTHCVISPTSNSTDRTSFAATMSSPAVVPALEIPPTTPTKQEQPASTESEKINTTSATTNGHEEKHEHNDEHVQHAQHVEEKEVNDAIEEMNRAVAGEEELETPDVSTAAFTAAPFEAEHEHVAEQHKEQLQETITSEPATEVKAATPEIVHATAVVTSLDYVEEAEQHNGQHGHEHNGHVENGHSENEHTTNGHADVTISHTNGAPAVPAATTAAGPCIPAPDPSGALGVNFEPKTVVSFSHELGSDANKYPDTVKVLKENEATSPTVVDEKLKELSKLKFEIIAGEKHDDLEITPVIKTE